MKVRVELEGSVIDVKGFLEEIITLTKTWMIESVEIKIKYEG